MDFSDIEDALNEFNSFDFTDLKPSESEYIVYTLFSYWHESDSVNVSSDDSGEKMSYLENDCK